MSKFKFGDRVVHETLGWGVVTTVDVQDEGEAIYFVHFPQTGRALLESELTPYTPPAPEGTIPVRIAVAVSEFGDYGCNGWSDGDAEAVASAACDGLPSKVLVSWVTAHVPLPQPPADVRGEVEGC